MVTTKVTPLSLGYLLPGARPLAIKSPDGCLFVVRPKTTDISSALLSLEFYELNNWFIPNAKGVVVDCGASVGGYTVRACRYATQVVAVEPQPGVFEVLRSNIQANSGSKNVVLIKKAVGDRSGTTLMSIPKKQYVVDILTATIVPNYVPFPNAEKCYNAFMKEEVEMDTLDNILTGLGIAQIDFLKIDIEGAEGLAFKGMTETLKKTKYLMIEIKDENLWLTEELEKLGFELLDKHGLNYFYLKKAIADNQPNVKIASNS